MATFIRAAWALGAFLGTYLLATLLLLVFGGTGLVGGLLAVAAAIAMARQVWLRPPDQSGSVLAYALVGAVVLGGIGFAAGFFGPMILAPQANQGPLLGIFITGPAGVAIGAIVGAIYGSRRLRQGP